MWVISWQVQLYPFLLSSFDRLWENLYHIQLCPSSLSSLHSGPVDLTGSEWFHARSSCVSSHCLYSHSGPIGLTASEWFHARSSCVPSHCLYSPFWSYWLDREWVITCQVQLYPFSLFSLPLWSCCLDRKWVIPCHVWCVPSHYPYFHSCAVGLIVCEWFHDRSSCIPSHCPHTHSGPIALTGCEKIHIISSYVPPHCSHFHSGPVDLTESEWFHAKSSVSLLTVLTPTVVLLAWQKVSDSIQVQLCPFSLSLLPLWSYWLDREWVIS